ncbi:MAG TPA: hypothetical protein PK668_12915 [Myxococcota bacterium]|nr:hypothetical protein [Myxococcota bacterium]HRY93628.1 hypothetical protein [Myxococcota bacterium]HSA21812.1 hypothetical protein [Myxococcota bacterium]
MPRHALPVWPILAGLLLVGPPAGAQEGAPLRVVARAEAELQVGRGAEGVWLVLSGQEPTLFRWRESGVGKLTTSKLPGFERAWRAEARGDGPVVFGWSQGEERVAALRGNRLERLPRPHERASLLWLVKGKPWAALAEVPVGKLSERQVWWRGGRLRFPSQAHAVPGLSPALGPACQRLIPAALDADPGEGRLAVALSGCSREEPAELALYDLGRKAPRRIPLGKELHPEAVLLQGARALVLVKRDDLRTCSELLPLLVDLEGGAVATGPALPRRALEVHAADSAPGGGLWARIYVEDGPERLAPTLWRYDGAWRQETLLDPQGQALEPVSQAVDPAGHLWVTAEPPAREGTRPHDRWLLTSSPWPRGTLLLTARGARPEEPMPEPGPAPNVVPMPSNPDSVPFTESGLEVSLVAAGSFAAEGPVEILFRLRNKGAGAKRVCTVFTPFEQRDRFHLDVRDSQGASALRTGVKQAGPMPQPEDFVELAPGQVLEARVDLRKDHALPPGRYTARFQGSPHVNHLPDSPPLAFEIPAK